MVIVKCTAPDVLCINIWGSTVQSKATKNQHATTHTTHITHITHITLTPPTVRCFGFAQHDKSAITPPPQYPPTTMRVLLLIPVMFFSGGMVWLMSYYDIQ